MIETLLRQRSPSASIPGNQYLAVGSSVSPFLIIYKRNGDTYTKIPDPASMPPTGVTGVAWNGSIHLACLHSNYPYVTVYKRAGDTFTKLPDFTTNVGAATTGKVRFDQPPDYGLSTRMAFSYSVPPYFKMFTISGDTFAMHADPASLPGNASIVSGVYLADINFINSSFGSYLGVASAGIFIYTLANPPVKITQSMTTFITVRAVAGDSQYDQVWYSAGSTSYFYNINSGPTFTAATPATLTTSVSRGALERDTWGSGYYFNGGTVAPFFRAFYGPYTSNQFTVLEDTPSAIPSISVTYQANPTVACAHALSPFVTIYNYNGGANMVKVINPAVLPPGNATSVAFSAFF
jgi:hypothetical protein